MEQAMAGTNVLHLARQSGNQFYFDALGAHGWEIESKGSLGEALKSLSSNPFSFGLLRLNHADDFSVEQLNIFLDAAGDLPWIAVVEPSLLDNSALAELIYGRCDEHLVCSQNTEALTFALGQIIARVTGNSEIPAVLMDLRSARDVAEKQAIETTLEHFPGNMTKAAAQLGISRMTLYRLLHKHGLAEAHTRSA